MKLLVKKGDFDCEVMVKFIQYSGYDFVDILDIEKFDYVLPDVIGYKGVPTLVDNEGVCHYDHDEIIKVLKDAR